MTRCVGTLLCLLLLLGTLDPGALAQTPAAPPAQTPPPNAQSAPTPPPPVPELPFYGSDLLEQGIPTTTEALERAVNAKDYRLGSGDRLAINVWRSGKPTNLFDIAVPLEGKIFLPVIGEVSAAGRTIDELKQDLGRLVSRRLPGFQVSVLLTRLRSFRVLVLGEVARPGYVTANAVTRLSEVIATAKVNAIGSIRRIQVRRITGKVRAIDLYNFVARGSLDDNPLVADGEAFVVPRRYGLVEIRGAVGRPGRYEITEGETINDLLFFAGGPNTDAYMERGEVSRLKAWDAGLVDREVVVVNLERILKDPKSADNVPLKPSDILTVYSVSHFRGGKVRISGSVRQPGAYELVSEMRLRDLLFRSGGLLPDADLERVQLERIVDGQKAVLPQNLAKLLLEGDESQNIRLQVDDVIVVPSLLALAKVVFVEGRVARPGGYAWRENEMVSTLLVRAGGVVLELTLPQGSQDSALAAAPADLKACYIERTGPDGRKTRLSVDLQRLLVDRDLTADAKLQPGDVLVVPSRIQQVFVHGFVDRAGAFAYEPNRTVRHYIGLASPKPTADLQKVAVRRLDGSFAGGLDIPVQAGDTILVPEKQVIAVLQILGLVAPILNLILGR